MDANKLRKVLLIQKFATDTFSHDEWASLGTLTNSTDLLLSHPRLYRSMSFGDDDYPSCVAEVIQSICEKDPRNIDTIIDAYDIDLWLENKNPKQFQKIFKGKNFVNPAFWTNGYLKVFVSHLATSKGKANLLKKALYEWGMSCFVAHDDIEPTKQWMIEIESALNTMDVLIVLVEPGIKNSDWIDQEIGFALGRQIEVLSLRIGADPHGFLMKFQGIPAQGKHASILGNEIFKILSKKPEFQSKVLGSLFISFQSIASKSKMEKINLIEEMKILSDENMKELLEKSSLDSTEKYRLKEMIKKYKAFPDPVSPMPPAPEDDLPF